MTETTDTSSYVNRSIDVDSTLTDEATLGDAHGPDQGDVGVRITAPDVTIYVEPSRVDRTLRLSSYVTFTNEGDPIDTGDRIEVIGYLQVGSLGDATRIAEAVELGFQDDAAEALRLADFASRDGDLEGTDPTPVEQRDLSPFIREQERLIAQIAEVTDTTVPDPVTWADVQAVARLAENGMATQADEHAIELRRAWQDGYTAGGSRATRRMSDEPEVADAINPYPETTTASAPVTIDGASLTWYQLPGHVVTLHAKIRALAEAKGWAGVDSDR